MYCGILQPSAYNIQILFFITISSFDFFKSFLNFLVIHKTRNTGLIINLSSSCHTTIGLYPVLLVYLYSYRFCPKLMNWFNHNSKKQNIIYKFIAELRKVYSIISISMFKPSGIGTLITNLNALSSRPKSISLL